MIFKQTGLLDFVTTYRVDNKDRPGWKKLVCGICVDAAEATDPVRLSGHHLCDGCGKPVGSPEAFERADELLAKICPVAARQRAARLAENDASEDSQDCHACEGSGRSTYDERRPCSVCDGEGVLCDDN